MILPINKTRGDFNNKALHDVNMYSKIRPCSHFWQEESKASTVMSLCNKDIYHTVKKRRREIYCALNLLLKLRKKSAQKLAEN